MKKILIQEAKRGLSNNYPIVLVPDSQDGGYAALIPDLPGCISRGENQEAALRLIEKAKVAWIKAALQKGKPVPLPRETFSGKLMIRIPRILHRKLIYAAAKDGVTLNQKIIETLERGLAGA